MGIESPVHLLFIAVVALLVLGPKRLPGLARALGQGIREFRGSLEAGANPAEPDAPHAPDEQAFGADEQPGGPGEHPGRPAEVGEPSSAHPPPPGG